MTTSGTPPGPAGIHVVQTALKSLLVGEDPTAVETLWERMYRATLAYGQKGLVLMAISGVDLALWDLRGKRAGKPLAELLGGQVGQPIPYYKMGGSLEEISAVQGAGFGVVKLQVGKLDAAGAIEQIRQVRETVGPGIRIMTDAFMSWDVDTALRAAEGFQLYDVGWLEEPLPIDDLVMATSASNRTARCQLPGASTSIQRRRSRCGCSVACTL